MALNPEEQVRLAHQALVEVTDGGETMVSHEELAVAYMRRHPSFLRRQRRINEFREFFLLEPSEGPSKPPFKYRHQTSLALMAMKAEGTAGSVFVDPETGEPIKDPTPPLDHRNKRYFPIAEPTEAPVQDQAPPEGPATPMEALDLPEVPDHDRVVRRMPGGTM